MLSFGWSTLVLCKQVLQSLFQSFGDRVKCANYNWYHRHFHVPQFLQFSSKVKVTLSFFTFLSVLLCGQPERQSPLFGRFSFFFCFFLGGGCSFFFFFFFYLLLLSLGLVVWLRLGDPFESQNPREFCASHFPGRILFVSPNLNFFITQSYLVLYSLLLRSIILILILIFYEIF